jgi:hypothetical protein
VIGDLSIEVVSASLDAEPIGVEGEGRSSLIVVPVASRVGSPPDAPAASGHDQNGDLHVIKTCPEYLFQRSGAAGWLPSTYRSSARERRRLSLERYVPFWGQ